MNHGVCGLVPFHRPRNIGLRTLLRHRLQQVTSLACSQSLGRKQTNRDLDSVIEWQNSTKHLGEGYIFFELLKLEASTLAMKLVTTSRKETKKRCLLPRYLISGFMILMFSSSKQLGIHIMLNVSFRLFSMVSPLHN